MNNLSQLFSSVWNPTDWQFGHKRFVFRAVLGACFTACLLAFTLFLLGLVGLVPMNILRGALALAALAGVSVASYYVANHAGRIALRRKAAILATEEANASKAKSDAALEERKLKADVNAENLLALVRGSHKLFALQGNYLPSFENLQVHFTNKNGGAVIMNPSNFMKYLEVTHNAQEKLPEEVSWSTPAAHGDHRVPYVTCKRD